MLFHGQPEKRNLGFSQHPGVAKMRITKTAETLETLEERRVRWAAREPGF